MTTPKEDKGKAEKSEKVLPGQVPVPTARAVTTGRPHPDGGRRVASQPPRGMPVGVVRPSPGRALEPALPSPHQRLRAQIVAKATEVVGDGKKGAPVEPGKIEVLAASLLSDEVLTAHLLDLAMEAKALKIEDVVDAAAKVLVFMAAL